MGNRAVHALFPKTEAETGHGIKNAPQESACRAIEKSDVCPLRDCLFSGRNLMSVP